MENKDKPAFVQLISGDCDGRIQKSYGLTKREYFAAIALTGVVYNSTSDPGQVARNIELALTYADELLQKLKS